MRKIKYLLVLFLIILTSTKVSASTNTFDRTEDNNYGVKKNWDMNEKKYDYAKKTPYVDASEKIYDFSDILTDEEEKALYNRIIPLIEKYKMDIVILTYNYPYTEDMQNSYFVSDFYDFNDFGLDFEKYSGVVFFRNTYDLDPYFDMLSFGSAQLKFYDTRMSNILDDVYYDIHAHNYLDGFNLWLDKVEYYAETEDLSGYHLNKNGLNDYSKQFEQNKYEYQLLYTKYKEQSNIIDNLKRDFNPLIIGNLFLSGIITTIFIVVNVKKNKMVRKATQASEYLDRKTFKLLESSDRLINSHVTSWTETSSSSGGGGGGHSSFGGHSGGGFSSGGGRHG